MTIGIDDSKFFLVDHWPGEVTIGTNPSDFTNVYTAAQVAAGDAFPIGTKRAIYDDTNNGWATLCFLTYEKGSADAVAVKGLCGIDTAEMATAGNWPVVTNDGGECELTGPIAIALATMADGESAFFWVGGVCPVDKISGLDGIYLSDGNVDSAGVWMLLMNDTVAKFHTAAATDIATFSAFSMEIDTTA